MALVGQVWNQDQPSLLGGPQFLHVFVALLIHDAVLLAARKARFRPGRSETAVRKRLARSTRALCGNDRFFIRISMSLGAFVTLILGWDFSRSIWLSSIIVPRLLSFGG